MTDLWRYTPAYKPTAEYDYLAAVLSVEGIAHTIVIAESGNELAAEIIFPVNLQYIHSSGALDWTIREDDFAMSGRPIMRAQPGLTPVQPHLTDHYEFLGNGF